MKGSVQLAVNAKHTCPTHGLCEMCDHMVKLLPDISYEILSYFGWYLDIVKLLFSSFHCC